MPIHYRPDHAAHIAWITGEGRVTYEDCLGLIEAQRADVGRRLHELNDYRNVELHLTVPESERLARLNVELYAEVRDIRFAVVTDSDLGYGMSRVFQAYLDESVEFRIFTDHDEALAWVREAAAREAE